MDNIRSYIDGCLAKRGLEVSYVLQCQSSSGTAEQKLAYKVYRAGRGDGDYVLWFGNGFTPEVIEDCEQLGEILGVCVMSAGDFCEGVLNGTVQ